MIRNVNCISKSPFTFAVYCNLIIGIMSFMFTGSTHTQGERLLQGGDIRILATPGAISKSARIQVLSGFKVLVPWEVLALDKQHQVDFCSVVEACFLQQWGNQLSRSLPIISFTSVNHFLSPLCPSRCSNPFVIDFLIFLFNISLCLIYSVWLLFFYLDIDLKK